MTRSWRCVTCGLVTTDQRYTQFGHNHPGTIVKCCIPYWLEETDEPMPQPETQEERPPRGGYF